MGILDTWMVRSNGRDTYCGTSAYSEDERPKPADLSQMTDILSRAVGESLDLSGIAADKPSVDIVIPHYGDSDDLDRCLWSMEKDPCVGKTLIIDNNEKNRGFSAGVNEGIRELMASPNPYIAVVNNDTYILEGGFTPLVGRMIVSPKAGIVAPMAVVAGNPDQIQHAGGLQSFPNGVHRSGLRSLGHCADPVKCQWLSFVVVLIRKQAIVDVGLLDEKMFLIGSDSDYCYRMRYAGWDCWYEPSSVWAHKCGESSGATSAESAKVQRADMFRWYRKWIKAGGLYQELANEVV